MPSRLAGRGRVNRQVIAGTGAVLVRENDELIDVVNRYQGQGVLNLLSLDGVKEQVDSTIVGSFPAARPRRRMKLLKMLSAVRWPRR